MKRFRRWSDYSGFPLIHDHRALLFDASGKPFLPGRILIMVGQGVLRLLEESGQKALP